MLKENKKFIALAIFLAILLTPTVHALAVSSQDGSVSIDEKGQAVLNQVLGVDIASYSITKQENHNDAIISPLGTTVEDSILYNLVGDGTTLKTLQLFQNGKLQVIQVLEYKGEPHFNKLREKINNVEEAKGFLENYQAYSKNSLFSDISATLDKVIPGKNYTMVLNNMKLEIENYGKISNFKWYYIANGIEATNTKFVMLRSNDGFLEAFVDNWQFYDIGSTTVGISEDKAISVALEIARTHTWSLKLQSDTLNQNNFNESNVRLSSLHFDNSLDLQKSRSSDPLELYPVRRIGIALNKWYGDMYGITVDIWADTGEVRSVKEAWSHTLPPQGVQVVDPVIAEDSAPQNTNSSVTLDNQITPRTLAESNPIGLIIPVLAFSAVIAMWLIPRRMHTNKPRFLKTTKVVFVVALLVTILAPIATVGASRVGIVWGSESTGSINPDTGQSWRKHYPPDDPNERNLQRQTAADIAQWFGANGYSGINHQGSGSSRGQIFNDIQNVGYQNYLAAVDFDHGIGLAPGYPTLFTPNNEFHYMMENQQGTVWGDDPDHADPNHPGNAVYDMDVYNALQNGGAKAVFAFINTCLSGSVSDYVGNYYAAQRFESGPWPYQTRPVGMPLGWTGRLVKDIDNTPGFNLAQHMSNDGYGDPDMGPQVYIGFPLGSASLEQFIPASGGSTYYYYWVYHFFYTALYNDISVNQALDSASAAIFGYYFNGSPLRTGFQPYWWNFEGQWPTSTMAVYGNGNIHLKNYEAPPDSVAIRSLNGPAFGDIGVDYQVSASGADSKDHTISYEFDWGDGSSLTDTDFVSSYSTVNVYHHWDYAGVFNVRVRAQCSNGAWSDWSNAITVRIGTFYWLTVDAYDINYGYQLNPSIYIDGYWAGTAPMSIPVAEGWHTIAADDYWAYWYLVGFSDGYGNGESRPIYSETYVTAQYWPQF